MDRSSESLIRRRYYSDLGSFISVFSLVELILKRALAAIARMDEPTAKAMLSGTKIDAACSSIRRCFEARGKAIPDTLDAILRQLIAINNLRNDIIHYGTDFRLDPPVTSNIATVHMLERLRATEIAPDTLTAATTDLARIVYGLSIFATNGSGRLKKNDRDGLQWAGLSAWQYKQQTPKNKDRKPDRRQERQAPKPPRQP